MDQHRIPIMTTREFSAACKERGFIQKKSGFYRCIGEGIYQVIYVGCPVYVDPFSPWYDKTQRKSKRILIGLWSIYAKLLKYWFDPKSGKGIIDPPNLEGRREYSFLGLQDHYRIMKETGFDYLDSIRTHRELTDALDLLGEVNADVAASREKLIPLMICGESERALPIIDATLNDPYFIDWYSHTWDGDPKANDKKEALQDYLDLREAALSEEKRIQLMRRYYRRNMEMAEKYGIPIEGTFAPLLQ